MQSLSFLKNSFKHFSISIPKQNRFFQTDNRVGLKFSIKNEPNMLNKALEIIKQNNLNVTYMNTVPKQNSSSTYYIDLEANLKSNRLGKAFEQLKAVTTHIEYNQIKEVPWFPTNYFDLDLYGRVIISSETEESLKHPVFKDAKYRKRRDYIANVSNTYYMNMEENIPDIDYNEDENYTWSFMWDHLKPLHKEFACKEYNDNFELFEKAGVLTREKVPQLSKISKFLKARTGFIYRPVAGMLSQREFLNGLAYKVFHSTQYIRHREDPLYTPEPDIIHEVMGHSVMFADKDFADFSQAIGIASLGASDEDLVKLGNIYWFTVEFGIVKEEGKNKLYGAGILGSPSEIKWASSDKPNFYEFNFGKIAELSFSTTELQTNFFVVDSINFMKEKVYEYLESVKKPFKITYNAEKRTVEVDRAIITKRETNQYKDNELLF